MSEQQNVFLVNVYTFDDKNKHVNTYVFTTHEAADEAALDIETENSKLCAEVVEQKVFSAYYEWWRA